MVRRIAVEAGHITLQFFEMIDSAGAEQKGDGSPVTKADHESEKYIAKALRDLTPDIPVVAEEEIAKGAIPDITKTEHFWLVDPLDATKEFIAGGENYTVNIGLISNGVPSLGVVYAPALGALYAGFGEKAIRWSEDTGKEKDIRVRQAPAAGFTVMSSQYHADDTRMDKFLEPFKIEKILKRASSLKLCMLAEGKADLYPRLGQTSEWDTAAGEAVLRAAGGMLTDMNGKPLEYGGVSRNFVNPHFVAAAFPWFEGADD
jgi:3'(2'), 5'-bisphosphate nucleotidase